MNNNYKNKANSSNYAYKQSANDKSERESNTFTDKAEKTDPKKKALKIYVFAAIVIFAGACIFLFSKGHGFNISKGSTTIPETIIAEYDGIVVKALGSSELSKVAASAGYELLTISVDNGSSKAITCSVENVRINGIKSDSGFYSSVAPNGKAEEIMPINTEWFSFAGIEKIDTIELSVEIIDREDYSTIYEGQPVTISVSDTKTRESNIQKTNATLFNDHGVSVSILGAKAYKNGPVYAVYHVKNDTGYDISLQSDFVQVDGLSTQGLIYTNVNSKDEQYGIWSFSNNSTSSNQPLISSLNFDLQLSLQYQYQDETIAECNDINITFDKNGDAANITGELGLTESSETIDWTYDPSLSEEGIVDTNTETPVKTTIDETVLLDYEGVMVKATGYQIDSSGNEFIQISAENKSDKVIEYNISYRLNGLRFDNGTGDTVSINSVSEKSLLIQTYAIPLTSANKINQIELMVTLADPDEFETIYQSDFVNVPISDETEREYSVKTTSYDLYNQNGIIITIVGVKQDDVNVRLFTRITCPDGYDLMTSNDAIALDGVSAVGLLWPTIEENDTVLSSHMIYKNNKGENVKSITFDLSVYDWKSSFKVSCNNIVISLDDEGNITEVSGELT